MAKEKYVYLMINFKNLKLVLRIGWNVMLIDLVVRIILITFLQLQYPDW